MFRYRLRTLIVDDPGTAGAGVHSPNMGDAIGNRHTDHTEEFAASDSRPAHHAQRGARVTMFRFTIRDVLWLTGLVGLAIGWGIHDRVADERCLAVIEHAQKLKATLGTAKAKCEQLENNVHAALEIGKRDLVPDFDLWWYEVDWTILDEPIPTANDSK